MDQLLNTTEDLDTLTAVERKHGLQRDKEGKMVTSGERGGLVESDIHKAIDVLFETYGKQPTQVVLRNFIKKGSYGPLNAAINSWQAKQAEPAPEDASEKVEVEPIPTEMASVVSELVTTMVENLGRKLWIAASSSHVEQMAAERKIMEGHIAEMKQQVEKQIETADTVQALLDQKTEEFDQIAERLQQAADVIEERNALIDTQKDDLAHRDGRIEEIERERAEDRAENERLTRMIAELQTENTRLSTDIENEKRRSEEVRNENSQRIETLQADLTRERQRAEREAAAAAARELAIQTDKERLERKVEEDRRQAEAEMKEVRSEAAARLKAALEEASKTAAERVAAAKSETEAAKTTATALSDQITMLKNQISNLEKQIGNREVEEPKG